MKNIPYEFVIEDLISLGPLVKRMFGVHSIYIGETLFLALYRGDKHPQDHGIWIGTERKHHQYLKQHFPSIRALQGVPIKKWILLPEDSESFEEDAFRICQMIKNGDERIGVLSKKK